MEKKGFMRIFSIFAWVALMAISCWATTTSLHLLLPKWPTIVFWIITVIFFVLSSLGTKLIVDSCNKYIDTEHPGRNIAGGIIILLLFWIIFSVPTNTHTFFYKATIKDVVIQDLANTKAQLIDVKDDITAKQINNADKERFNADIQKKWGNVEAEVNNPGHLGWADAAERAMIDLETELGTSIQRVKLRRNDVAGRRELLRVLGKAVENAKQARLKEKYDIRLEAVARNKNMQEVQNDISIITAFQDTLKYNPWMYDEPTIQMTNTLKHSYALVGNYFDNVLNVFTESDSVALEPVREYVSQYKSNVTKTDKMRSVIDVWKGMFAGDTLYKGRGLWFWLIVALMVDIAGFIFFDIAFRKREY